MHGDLRPLASVARGKEAIPERHQAHQPLRYYVSRSRASSALRRSALLPICNTFVEPLQWAHGSNKNEAKA